MRPANSNQPRPTWDFRPDSCTMHRRTVSPLHRDASRCDRVLDTRTDTDTGTGTDTGTNTNTDTGTITDTDDTRKSRQPLRRQAYSKCTPRGPQYTENRSSNYSRARPSQLTARNKATMTRSVNQCGRVARRAHRYTLQEHRAVYGGLISFYKRLSENRTRCRAEWCRMQVAQIEKPITEDGHSLKQYAPGFRSERCGGSHPVKSFTGGFYDAGQPRLYVCR